MFDIHKGTRLTRTWNDFIRRKTNLINSLPTFLLGFVSVSRFQKFSLFLIKALQRLWISQATGHCTPPVIHKVFLPFELAVTSSTVYRSMTVIKVLPRNGLVAIWRRWTVNLLYAMHFTETRTL